MAGRLAQWVIADPQTVALLLAVSLAGAVAARLLRRRMHRRGRRRVGVVAAVTVATVFFAAGVADAVNVHFGYLPRVADLAAGSWPHVRPRDLVTEQTPVAEAALVRRYARGGVVAVPVSGSVVGRGFSHALVWLPPQYFAEPTRRFPVLYLLHGSPGVPADWLRGGRLAEVAGAAAHSGHPVIVVLPRMSRGWLDDSECVNGLHERPEQYLIADVLPAVDAQLRTIPDRAQRAIAGMSAGGYCALNIGLRHREAFGLIGDMSGLDRPTHDGGLAPLFGHGPSAAQQARANTPADYAATLRPQPQTRVWLDCGSSDGAPLTDARTMFTALRSRGIPVELHLRPGGHTFHVWVPALRAFLPWAAETMTSTARPAA